MNRDIPLDFPIPLEENIWVLGNYYFNLYLVVGNHSSALIEMGVSATADEVIGQLEALDISPSYLVVTHPHADHLTGLEGLRERYPGARVAAGRGAAKFIRHPKAVQSMMREDRYISSMLSARGLRPGRPPVERVSLPEEHLVVENGREIDLGGVAIRCMDISGHSPGNIVVQVPEAGALFVSDSLGFHYPGRCFLPLFFTGFPDYLASLDLIKSLEPKILGPGHQGPIRGEDAPRALHDSYEATVKLCSRILGDERDDEKIADDLFNEYYKDEFTIYSEENIRGCVRLLIRRAREGGR